MSMSEATLCGHGSCESDPDYGRTALCEAWAEVEAALPEGWVIDQLINATRWWVAIAAKPGSAKGTDAKGDTPAQALLALAGKLHANAIDDESGMAGIDADWGNP